MKKQQREEEGGDNREGIEGEGKRAERGKRERERGGGTGEKEES